MTRLYIKIHINISIVSLKREGGIWHVCVSGWAEARAEPTRKVLYVVVKA